MNRLIKENGQNQALKSSNVEVKVLILALHFSLFLCLYIYVLTCLVSFGLLSVYVRSMLGC